MSSPPAVTVAWWVRAIAATMPAGLAVPATTNLGTRPVPPWAGIGVLAARAAGALLLACLPLRRSDP